MTVNQWFLPTNTHNLSMMISQGLISEPAGSKKYYADILKNYPGYIPVIKDSEIDKITDALDVALSNEEYLIPCIIVINIKKIKKGIIYSNNESKISVSDNHFLTDDMTMLCIPSPLSIDCISTILFNSNADKRKYIGDTKTLYKNVSLSNIKLDSNKSTQKYFANKGNALSVFNTIESKNLDFELPIRKKIDYNKVYSFGGVLGSLFYITKNGKKSENYFKRFIDSSHDIDSDAIDYDFQILMKYFYNNISEETSSSIKMIFPILDTIVDNDDIKNSIIKKLKSTEFEDKIKIRTDEIADLLLDYSRNKINKPQSEIFKESLSKSKKSKFEVLLLMMFYKDNAGALFESKFENNLDIFNETDFVLFAILFGMKDKYKGLPSFIKDYDGVQLYLSNMMAKYAHKLSDSDIDFDDHKLPTTLNNMLTSNKLDFILWLNKTMGLDNCFKSIMPNKDYTQINGKQIYQGIVLPKLEKIESNYFKVMSKKIIDDKLYNKIIDKYKKFK